MKEGSLKMLTGSCIKTNCVCFPLFRGSTYQHEEGGGGEGGIRIKTTQGKKSDFFKCRDWLENWLSAADSELNKRNIYMSLK